MRERREGIPAGAPSRRARPMPMPGAAHARRAHGGGASLVRSLVALCLGLLLALGPVAESASAAGDPTPPAIRIGSKRFPESYLLAHLLGEAAAPHARVTLRTGLGNTAITWEALRSGAIDLYPEYLGTIDQEILKNTERSGPERLAAQLATQGIGLAIPFGFANGYAIAMREPVAQAAGIETLSDLAAHPRLRLGLTAEFIGRADGWPGLSTRYGLRQTPVSLDHGLAYDALATDNVDAIDIYTTDSRIGELGLRVLRDDRDHFPRYDAVVLYRLDLPARAPAAWAAMQSLAGRIDATTMIALNARAELKSQPFEAIARDAWQALSPGAARPQSGAAEAGRSTDAGTSSETDATDATDATGTADRRVTAAPASPAAPAAPRAAAGLGERLLAADLTRLTVQHLALVLGSTLLALLLGLPLGIAVAARPRARAVTLAATGLLQTVPSLAMLAGLVGLTGLIGAVPALVALTLYALLPVLRNTVVGLHGVPQGLRQAAMALGLSSRDRLRHVTLPLALPAILAGVRTATTIGVGTATIAAFIGAGGYGERIVAGLALNDRALLLAGALPAAAMALVLEGVFELIERRVTRRAG